MQTHKQVIEERLDMGIHDLEIAREQLVRHSADLPTSLHPAEVLKHIEEALRALELIYV